jgi:GntR family transcriptional regulator, transcriptional repressor for pyruvate dehydrogenase complex
VTRTARVRLGATRSIAAGGDDDRRLEVFQPVRVQKAANEVCIAVLDALRSGVFTVGDRLPREKDLAERFDVSVNTVSEALGIVERAGIVEQRRGRYGGTYVVSLANVRVVLASMLASSEHSGSQAQLRGLLELRRPLELQAALLTATRAGDEHMVQLRRLADALDPGLDTAEFRATDVQFHLYLGEACGNTRLRDYLRTYFDEYQLLRDRFPVQHLERDVAARLQHRYLDAIASRDRERVVAAADEHLSAVEELLLGARLTFP